METNNTRTTNKNKNMKLKNTTLQPTWLKTLELQRKNVFRVWKQNKKPKTTKQEQNKNIPKTKPTTKTEGQKHKIWKHKQKQQKK